jgi:hypothetical protein
MRGRPTSPVQGVGKQALAVSSGAVGLTEKTPRNDGSVCCRFIHASKTLSGERYEKAYQQG